MKQKLKLVVLLMVTMSTITSTAQEKVNILNTDYYGFEVTSGDDGWWMQQPENFSISTNKGANSSIHSLKYTNNTTFSGSKKAFGSTTIDDMLIDVEAGTYTLKTMVWLETESNITAVKINFRTDGENEVNTEFDLSTIAKNQWVEVVTQFTTPHNFVNTNVRVLMQSNYGTGTMYLDNLQLLVDAPEEAITLPFLSQISTIESENLTTDKGVYNVSLQVWVDENTTISNFYTQVLNPWVSLKWDISSVAKKEWVTLSQEMVLSTNAINSEFRFLVNNQPELGGGKGTFYIDDFKIVKNEGDLSTEQPSTETEVLFTPNPASNFIEFNLPKNSKVEVYNAIGRKIKTIKIDALQHREAISNLAKGIYYLKILQINTTAIKQLIVN